MSSTKSIKISSRVCIECNITIYREGQKYCSNQCRYISKTLKSITSDVEVVASDGKYFLLYKITNITNGKYYIGAHETLNPLDSYRGSGRAIRAAIKKHGCQNFTKTIIGSYLNSEDMYAAERELITPEILASPDTYNMNIGGAGGFSDESRRKAVAACKLKNQNRPLSERQLNALNRPKRGSLEHREALKATWNNKDIDSKRRGGSALGANAFPKYVYEVLCPDGSVLTLTYMSKFCKSIGIRCYSTKTLERAGYKILNKSKYIR